MRGKTLFAASQRHDVMTRHAVKFGCYHALKKHVRMLETGERIESQWLGLRREEAKALVTFYGVTAWPGERKKLTKRRGEKVTRYIPRPNWYRAGSPLVLETRWRCRDIEGAHSTDELLRKIKKSNPMLACDKVSDLPGVTPVHMLMLNPDMLREWRNA
ncbi:hypothetical protein JT350_gp29 [Salmonella phage SAP012]|uniref:Uncharacterized protein n=1 Tax=Salmonella phage SAP012 TaxID=2742114 RepID=A0A6J4EFE1_9CAUD|nr:hypothetical protein JT350_gp29 [Salmonella phage SAP012]BCG45192.1 hypothetical protein [Salmonella phage SAP012]